MKKTRGLNKSVSSGRSNMKNKILSGTKIKFDANTGDLKETTILKSTFQSGTRIISCVSKTMMMETVLTMKIAARPRDLVSL